MHLAGVDLTLPSPSSLLPSRDDCAGLAGRWHTELLAGLTVGIVALPLALGFGVASGAGAGAGLVTAVIAGVVAAVFGGSHLQVSGPTGAMTVVLLPVIAQYGLGSVPLLAVMAGLIVIIMGVTGLGRSVDLIPWPVVEGFTFGIGIIIAVQQIPLAVDSAKGPSESTLVSSWQTLLATDWPRALAPLGLVVLVIGTHVAMRRWLPTWPASLVAIVAATLVAELGRLEVHRITSLPTGIPTPRLPEATWTTVTSLAAPALAVAALAALESLLSARVADGALPDVARTNPDRELVGQGLANVASGLFGGLPATGAIARTAVNIRSGGRTRLSAIVHSLVLVLVIVALGPIVARIPLAALAGVLIVTATRMMDGAVVGRIWRTTRADRLTFALTCATTVLLDLIAAVLLGVAMAAVMSLRHMAATSAVRREQLPVSTPIGLVDFPTDELHEQVAVVRVDGALFYGDARRFVETLEQVKGVRGVIVRLHRMRVMDASGGEALREGVRALRRRGVQIVVQGLSPHQLKTAVATGAISPDEHTHDLPGAIDLMCARLGQAGHARVVDDATALFSYGAFTQSCVHREVYGRRLVGQLDALAGHRLHLIAADDERLGVGQQPAAVPTDDPHDVIAGMLFEVTPLELAAADDINSAHFDRVRVRLVSGRSAWAFVLRPAEGPQHATTHTGPEEPAPAHDRPRVLDPHDVASTATR